MGWRAKKWSKAFDIFHLIMSWLSLTIVAVLVLWAQFGPDMHEKVEVEKVGMFAIMALLFMFLSWLLFTQRRVFTLMEKLKEKVN